MIDIKITSKECVQELKVQALQFFVTQLVQTYDCEILELHTYIHALIKIIQQTAYYSLKRDLGREVTGDDFTPESIQRATDLFSMFSYLMHNPESRAEYEKEVEKEVEKEHIKLLQKHVESVLREMPPFPKFTPKTES